MSSELTIYKNTGLEAGIFIYGAPGEIRTPDHLVRSQVLYPAELRARNSLVPQA
jgi:hypothetical protein